MNLGVFFLMSFGASISFELLIPLLSLLEEELGLFLFIFAPFCIGLPFF